MTQVDAAPLSYATTPAGVNQKLYDSGAVGLATFFGTPIAGTVVMAMNYRRLGKPSAGTKAIIIGVLVTAALMVSGFFIPMGTATTAIGVGVLAATVGTANALQGKTIAEHKLAGGLIGSRWVGFGIGMIGLAIFGGLIAGLVLSTGLSGTKLTIGTKDEVYYAGTATQAEAKALGDSLKAIGFFQDRGVSVQLRKGSGPTIIGFVVKDGAWDNAQNVQIFQTIVQTVAPSVGGLPVKLRLLNSYGWTKKEVDVK